MLSFQYNRTSNVFVDVNVSEMNHNFKFLLILGVVFILLWHSRLNYESCEPDTGHFKIGHCLEINAFLVKQGLTLKACQEECAKRKKCKSLTYNRRYPLCKLSDPDQSDSSIQACPGYVYIEITAESSLRPASCSSCEDNEVCENSTHCAIKECSDLLPSSNGIVIGNLHVVGSKRLHVCNAGYRLTPQAIETSEIVICNKTGAWEPDIHECIRTMKEFYNPSNSGSPAYALHNLHADGFSIVNKSSFNLWCKVTNDFHILLKKDENEYNSNVIEIVIGGWGNSKSVIRNAQQGTNRDTYQESNILSSSEYREFWVSWANDIICVGKGGEVGSQEILSWAMSPIHAINYVSMGVGYGGEGYFKI